MVLRQPIIMLALLLVGLLAGCNSAEFTPGVGDSVYNISGGYLSEEAVGSVGRLMLDLSLREDTRVYDAVLLFIDNDELGRSEGFGTLGLQHLSLNFDRGTEADYYFEGTLELEGDTLLAIDGNLVFADLAKPLPVRFVH